MEKNTKKKSNNAASKKLNIKPILILAVVVILIVVLVLVIKGSSGASTVSTDLDTEIWLGVRETLTTQNGDDSISLYIDSDLAYVDGEEYEVEYTLTVNDTVYNGTYTFATGYSIHSEPNGIPYSVTFVGIEEGSIGVMISQNE